MIRPFLSFLIAIGPLCNAEFVIKAYDDIYKFPIYGINDTLATISTPGNKVTTPASKDECALSPDLVEEIRGYQETVDNIIEYIVNGDYKGRTYNILAELVDTFGPRMTGSGQLEAAIDWMLEKSHEEGLENVHTEDVTVPHWVRNNESAWMVLPRLHKLNMLGLGSSVGTPPEGIRAEVLVVKDFDDLEQNAHLAAGKIVVYNPPWISYGETVQYRASGATRAAKVGAVASLIRTVGPFSIDSPHTGHQYYGNASAKIPTACITVEDAAMMERIQKRGQKIEILLTMGAMNYPDFISRNSIVEVEGLEWPDETVVVSGHLDSWDVGQGAMDDGGGAMISWNAAVVLRRLDLRPRRTLQAILWTGEEQGLIGGQAYFDKHSAKKEKYQMLMESDIGTFSPLGLAFSGNSEATCIVKEILKLLKSLNTTERRYADLGASAECGGAPRPAEGRCPGAGTAELGLLRARSGKSTGHVAWGKSCGTSASSWRERSKVVSPMDGGPDIEVWQRAGVPTASLYNENETYFWFHHSDGDTMSVEDPDTLDKCLALWTSFAYVAADITHKIPQTEVQQEGPRVTTTAP